MDTTVDWLCEDPNGGSYHDLRDEMAPSFLDDSILSTSPSLEKRRRSPRLLTRESSVLPNSPLASISSVKSSPRSVAATPLLAKRVIMNSSRNAPCATPCPPLSTCRRTNNVQATPMTAVRGSRLPMSDAKARGITFSLFKTPPKSSLGLTCRPVGQSEGEGVLRRLSFTNLLKEKVEVEEDDDYENSKENVSFRGSEPTACDLSSTMQLACTPRKLATATPAKELRRTASSCTPASRQRWQESRSLKTPAVRSIRSPAKQRSALGSSSGIDDSSASSSLSACRTNLSLGRLSRKRPAMPSTTVLETRSKSRSSNLTRSATMQSGRSRPVVKSRFTQNGPVQGAERQVLATEKSATSTTRSSSSARSWKNLSLLPPGKSLKKSKSPVGERQPATTQGKSKASAASHASAFCSKLR